MPIKGRLPARPFCVPYYLLEIASIDLAWWDVVNRLAVLFDESLGNSAAQFLKSPYAPRGPSAAFPGPVGPGFAHLALRRGLRGDVRRHKGQKKLVTVLPCPMAAAKTSGTVGLGIGIVDRVEVVADNRTPACLCLSSWGVLHWAITYYLNKEAFASLTQDLYGGQKPALSILRIRHVVQEIQTHLHGGETAVYVRKSLEVV